MRTRLISAAVLVPVVVVLFWLGAPWLTLGICLLGALAAYETVQLLRSAGLGGSARVAVIATPLLIFTFAWAADHGTFPRDYAVVPVALALAVLAAALAGVELHEAALGFTAWLGTMIATLYPALLGFAAMFVGLAPKQTTESLFGLNIDGGRLALVVLVAAVWTLDSAAYVVGKYFPRGHFMNHISPKKTWSGAIAGTIAAVVVSSVLFAGTSPAPFPNAVVGAVAGLLIAIAAQLGDLTESMLKRAAGAKDSGTLIPGHGGFLDRLDSFLFAAPAFFAVAVFINFSSWQPYP
ncbi:MAG: phosphatidate cytidylyltransferase [Chloroflexota bacterium]